MAKRKKPNPPGKTPEPSPQQAPTEVDDLLLRMASKATRYDGVPGHVMKFFLDRKWPVKDGWFIDRDSGERMEPKDLMAAYISPDPDTHAVAKEIARLSNEAMDNDLRNS